MLDKENTREELRGIFALGLLAVLVVVRFQNEKLMVTIGQSSLDFIPVINFTILLWSLYAFFMVLGLSDDIIGNSFAETFRNLSKLCLRLDFLLSAFIGILYFIIGYQTRALWIIGLAGLSALFGILLLVIRKLRLKGILKKPTIDKLDLLERVFLILFLIFLVALFYYPDEQYFVVFFVLGFVSYVVSSLARVKRQDKPSPHSS